MAKQKVYTIRKNEHILGVYASREMAFRFIQSNEYTKISQTVKTQDGDEEISVDKDTFYLGVELYVHMAAHTETDDALGLQYEVKEEDAVYVIEEFEVKGSDTTDSPSFQDFMKIASHKVTAENGRFIHHGSLSPSVSWVDGLLPDNLTVEGDLYLFYKRVRSLPKGLIVEGDLFIGGTDISVLPPDLIVKGSLSANATNVEHFPDTLFFGDSLNLDNTKITRLPDGLTVCGFLSLSCSSIQSLPNGLTVDGELDISGTSISELPAGLKVKGDLFADGTQLSGLPADLEVEGDVHVNDTFIHTEPNCPKVSGLIYYDEL